MFLRRLSGGKSGSFCRGSLKLWLCLTVAAGLFWLSPAVAETLPKEVRPQVEATEGFGRVSELTPAFKPGEKMRWRVTYMGLTAGDLRASVSQDSYAGRPVYRLELRASSRGTASWLYTVRDRAVSFMDVKGLFSWGYEYFKNHEDEQEEQKVRYNQEEGFFVREDGERGEIPRYTQDVLSAVYYLRSRDFEVGDRFSFPVQMDKESSKIHLDVSRIEDVKTYDGWKKAYLVKTSLSQKKDGEEVTDRVERIRFWLSTDERKVPYQIAVAAYFGSIYGYLEDYSLTGGEK